MPIFHAIVLGIIQGLTEFLPISSSAHLIIIPWLLGWDDGGLTFDVALHAGTLVALLVYFHKEWTRMFLAIFKLRPNDLKNLDSEAVNPDTRMAVYIVLATIPGA